MQFGLLESVLAQFEDDVVSIVQLAFDWRLQIGEIRDAAWSLILFLKKTNIRVRFSY